MKVLNLMHEEKIQQNMPKAAKQITAMGCHTTLHQMAH
jgi:hypothetical protein